MLALLHIKYLEFREHWQKGGFLSACRRALYKEEELVPVVKILEELPPLKVPAEELRLVEVTLRTLSSMQLEYSLSSRRKRAEYYFRRGYRGLAMVLEGKVVCDVWYVSCASSKTLNIHPHVKLFGINLSENEVYMFDMHVDPDKRKRGLATFFMSSCLRYLHNKGYQKAFGSFVVNNTPALWVHRLIGYRELPHFIVRRIFLYETGRPKG